MRSLLVTFQLAVVGAVGLAITGSARGEDQYWAIKEGRSTIRLNEDVLAKLGLTVTPTDGSASRSDSINFSVSHETPFVSAQDDLSTGTFSNLQVFHQGGLSFRTEFGSFQMGSLMLDRSAGITSPDYVDTAPRLLVIGGDRLMDMPTKTFVISNGSVVISPTLADMLGNPILANARIGSVVMELHFIPPSGVTVDTENSPRDSCHPPSPGPDVVVGALEADSTPYINNYAHVGTIDAFSIATYSLNIGSVDVNWIANSVNHPAIGGHMYRYEQVNGAGRFEQVGLGWMKHGFEALPNNLDCTCNGDWNTVLGLGCADPYTSARNGVQKTTSGGLGPRFQINAHTGAFTWPYMFRNTSAPDASDNSIKRRVQVQFADLDPSVNPGAQYFVEAQYVTADDALAGNQNNNASYATCTMAAVGSPPTEFNATYTGPTVRMKSAIQAWKAIDSSVTETAVDVPEDGGTATGRVIVSAKATDLGTGFWHYEYAVYNMNSDRCIQAFTVPVTPYAHVQNIGFHDVFYHSWDGCGSSSSAGITFDGTDWPGTVSSSTVHWNMVALTGAGATAPCNSNAIRFGTTYNFRFDADLPPTTGNATLTQWKVFNNVAASTVVPASVNCVHGDMNNDGFIDGADIQRFCDIFVNGGGSPTERCSGDLEGAPDGNIGNNDLDPFVDCVLNGGCP